MPQAKKSATDNHKVEVILPDSISKKHSVRFETEQAGVAVSNLYLRMDAFRQLGNPKAVKVTIEAHEQEA